MRTRKQILRKVRKALVLPTDDAQQERFERVLAERQATIERLEREYADLRAKLDARAVALLDKIDLLTKERDQAWRKAATVSFAGGEDQQALVDELRVILAAVRLDYLTLATRAVDSRKIRSDYGYPED